MRNKKINSYIKTGILLIIIPIILVIIGPKVMKFSIDSVDAINRLESPSMTHFMGTDDLGRDIFVRTVYGVRISLFIGFTVTLISLIVGVFIGIITAYYPFMEKILMRIVDVIMAFPAIIVAIALAGILGSGVKNIIIALSISYFPTIARVTRNAVIDVKSSEYIQSAIVVGKNDLYIVLNCILPNIVSPILVQVTYIFAMAILNESILSFLGVGIKVPMPSLGGMVSDGRNYFTVAPWMVVFPGLMISWIVLSLNMIGDGLREYFNPKSNR